MTEVEDALAHIEYLGSVLQKVRDADGYWHLGILRLDKLTGKYWFEPWRPDDKGFLGPWRDE